MKDYYKINRDDREIVYNGRYGVKWSISNPYDLGTRCFDAIGKIAFIGVAGNLGYSDFDYIYPWSDIKRCNIVRSGNGSESIVFEGEKGFALDGTNGDVFVRIPRFSVERYVENGFEYRVISSDDEHIHPAFIEKGRVLDAVYISAFEGWYNPEDQMLYSIGGVIPSSNISGEDFLKAAKAKGRNYTLYDNRSVDLVFDLLAVEFGCRNSSRILGYGYADYWQPVQKDQNMVIEDMKNTNEVRVKLMTPIIHNLFPAGSNITICKGSQTNIVAQRRIIAIKDNEKEGYTSVIFDGDPINVDISCFIGSAACTTNLCELCVDIIQLKWHTGCADIISQSNTKNPIRYRWMENLWGSLWSFLPDVSFDGMSMYVCDDMLGYELCRTTPPYYQVYSSLPENTDNGDKSDNIDVNYWIVSLIGDEVSGISFGRDFDKSLKSTDAFGAYYYLSPSNVCIVNGGGFDHLWRCNILTNRAWITKGTRWYLYGARLLYKQLIDED